MRLEVSAFPLFAEQRGGKEGGELLIKRSIKRDCFKLKEAGQIKSSFFYKNHNDYLFKQFIVICFERFSIDKIEKSKLSEIIEIVPVILK